MKNRVWLRIGALVVLFLLGVWYIAFDVAGRSIVHQPYTVTVQLPVAGGIYPAAEVTYRGVTVGRVTSLRLQAKGVAVRLSIDSGTKIPADSAPAVRQLTAAGEQYLDLVPKATGAPYLKGGSVLQGGADSVPVSVGQVLSDTGSLLNSLNTGDLATVDQTLATGFANAGDNLRNIIVGGQAVTMALAEAEPATVTLLTSGRSVLQTLNATNGDFAQFTASLNQLTGQLDRSNGDLVQLFASGSAASKAASQLLTQSGSSLAQLIDNLATASSAGASQTAAMQTLFATLPVFAGRISSVARNGSLNVELYINSSSPVCDYEGAPVTSPTAGASPLFLTGQCTSSAPNLLQRGAQTVTGG